MPQLAPRILKDAEAADRTYSVATFTGNRAVFVDKVTQTSFANQSTLTETTRATAKGNDGHRFDLAIAYPHPVVDQAGCCVDKDSPAASYININALASKHAPSGDLDDLIAIFRSYVASPAFADLVKGGSNW